MAVYLATRRRRYKGSLQAAQSLLGCSSFGELTAEHLQRFSAEVLADRRARPSKATAVSVLRKFLLWAAIRGWCQLDPTLIRS